MLPRARSRDAMRPFYLITVAVLAAQSLGSGFAFGQSAVSDEAVAPGRSETNRLDRLASLGTPVVVSRADVDSPLARVRGLEVVLDSAPAVEISTAADPAFKAVLLTPLGSTGRP